MKVVAGEFRGRLLTSPNTSDTRPVTLIVRNAIFNTLASRLSEAIVLDLFAGSGALGIEAISRGVASATFVDISTQAIAAIKKNITSLNIANKTAVYKQDVEQYLSKSKELFDIIFLDPPYEQWHDTLLERANGRLKPDGVLVVSSSKNTMLSDTIAPLELAQEKTYGDTKITYFIKKS